MSAPVPEGTIICLLCGGAFLYPGPRYMAHLLHEHGVVYDVDFLVQVSLHKKSFSRLPAILAQSNFVSDNFSQTEVTEKSLCENCLWTGENQTGQVKDDEDKGKTYKFDTDQLETLVIKPDIAASRVKDIKRSEPLATDLQCFFNCGEVFKKGYDLELHLKLRHKEEDPLEQVRAMEAAKFEIALTKRSGSVYQCAICDKTVQGWSPFWEHIRKHGVRLTDYRAQYGKCEIESASFKCRICDKVLKHESNIIHQHLQHVHGINWNQYLARVRDELRGIQQEPLPEVALEKCKICNLRVKYIKIHMKNRHGIIKKVKCHICDQSIKFLKSHLKKRHGITKDEYDQLQSEVGYAPPLPDLNQNVNLSNLATSAPNFSDLPKPSKEEMRNRTVKHCSVCELEFNNRALFIEHCQNVHNIKFKTKAHGFLKLVPPQDKRSTPNHGKHFNPTYPPNSSPSQSQSKVSKIVWPQLSKNKECSLACEDCGEKFTTWRALNQHLKLNCQRVSCEACEKTYLSLTALKKHRKFSCQGNLKSEQQPVAIAKQIVEQIVSRVFSVSSGPCVGFKCPHETCGQHFGRSLHLKRHLSTIHDE